MAGLGLLLLRVTAGGVLVEQGALPLVRGTGAWLAALAGLSILAGLALMTGSFTPAAAALGAALVLARLLPAAPPPWSITASGLLLVMTVAVGLLGPGAYSLDARLFGRREIEVPRRAPGG